MADEAGSTPKGFAGFGDLVSKVDVAPLPISKPVDAAAPAAWPPAGKPVASLGELRLANQSLPPSPGLKFGVLLGIGAAILGLVLWATGRKDGQPHTRPASGAQAVVAVAASPPPARRPATAAVPLAPPSELWMENKPPAGEGLRLNHDQIRYCLSEDIRLQAWLGAVNNSSAASKDAYNAGADDYNARCGHFQYRRGLLEIVRAEVEARRPDLEREGRARAVRSP
jgi:hypothetical protein